MKKLLIYGSIAIGQCIFASKASAQFSNYFEVHSIAISDVNSQLVELLSENHPQAAHQLAAKALANLQKLTSATPDLNSTTVFEIGFDDAIISKSKTKLTDIDVYSFNALSDAAKNQVVAELERKYSPHFFVMALQVRKLKLQYATALVRNLSPTSLNAAEAIAAEGAALDFISDTLAVPFLLKNSKTEIVYGYDFLDLLNGTIQQSSLAAEFASVNARLTDLFVQTVNRSKNPVLVNVKGSRRLNPVASYLTFKGQLSARRYMALIQQQEGNKKYVQ